MDNAVTNQPSTWPEIRQRVQELYQLGWEQDQIARTLGIPAGAVRHWLRRAQADEGQRIARITEHFRLPSEQNIHLFWDVPDTRIIQSHVVKAAQDLSFHLAILEGTKIDNTRALLTTVGDLYEFPKFPNYEYETWDGTNDWMSDLTWLTEGRTGASQVKGFLLFYLDPLPLFRADLYAFTIFLDIIKDSAAYHQKAGLPFHIVMGSLDGKALSFMHVLKASDHTCPSCPLFL